MDLKTTSDNKLIRSSATFTSGSSITELSSNTSYTISITASRSHLRSNVSSINVTTLSPPITVSSITPTDTTSVEKYTLYKFRNNGALSFTNVLNRTINIVVFCVGGGGGGGGSSYSSGGGGAGDVKETMFSFNADSTFTITIGNGGAGGAYTNSDNNSSSNGENTIVQSTDFSFSAIGGGRGSGNYNFASNPSSGCAGGGSKRFPSNNTSAIPTNLTAKNGGISGGNRGGGGGGAGSNANGIYGGNGKTATILGLPTSTYYGGGGGGGIDTKEDFVSEGKGGGGRGGGGYGVGRFIAGNGVTNTGGGGGGANEGAGGAGGSGYCIISVCPTNNIIFN